MHLRKIAGFAFALTLAAPVGLMLGTGSATAATGQKCGTLSGSATISPGLSTVPANQTVTASGTLASCTPSSATGGGGSLHATTTLKNGSCQGLASGTTLPLKGSIKWKNGKTSAVSITAKTTSSAPTVATFSGKVSSGLFAGQPVGGKITFTIKSGQNCTSVPVKNLTFNNKVNGKAVPFTL